MSQLIACPEPVEFEHLLSGDLPSDKVEQLASHLEQCPNCVATFAGLGGDTLSDSLRSTAGAEDFAEKKMSILIASCRSAASAAATGASTSNLRTINEVPNANTAEDEIDLSFLSPPQEIGEIGRLDGYRVLKLLGVGGMGLVFEAEDIKLKRRVAMKVMKKEIAAKAAHRQRFLREAQSAAKVEHDHIVPIYQIGEENGVPFIAMPFLKGEPLDVRMQRSRLDILEMVTIAHQAAEGLAAAHGHGLIHRDIKPGNIWLETVGGVQWTVGSQTGIKGGQLPEGGVSDRLPTAHRPLPTLRVRILDFGLARVTGEQVQLTQTGAIMGTPAYMAPEQARSVTIDHRADLFSLGCVMYEMATGRRPFSGHDTMSILASLALDSPEEPAKLNTQLSPQLSELIMRLLEKDPARRPPNGAVVSDLLRRMMPDSTLVTGASRTQIEASPWAGINALHDKSAITQPEVIKPKTGFGKRATGKPALLVGALFSVAAIAVAIIVIIRDKDGKKIGEFKVPEGGKVEVVDEGGKADKRSTELPWLKMELLKPGATLLPPGKVAKVAAMEVRGTAGAKSSVKILEVEKPEAPSHHYKLTGSIKYEGVEGSGHVEMWSQFADGQAYFSKTIADDGPLQKLEGTSEWRSLALPFFSEPGKLPVKIWVNVVLPGKGTVYLSPLFLSAMSADSDLLGAGAGVEVKVEKSPAGANAALPEMLPMPSEKK